jgi:hypothetical protein
MSFPANPSDQQTYTNPIGTVYVYNLSRNAWNIRTTNIGVTGIQGLTGLALGSTGISGQTGIQGGTGATGIQGITGFYGETGIQGVGISTTWTGFTPTTFGWTTDRTTDCSYSKTGTRIWINYYIRGTSNSTLTNMELPFTAMHMGGQSSFIGFHRVTDAGGGKLQPGASIINSDATRCDFYPDFQNFGWSNSLLKIVDGNIMYDATA